MATPLLTLAFLLATDGEVEVAPDAAPPATNISFGEEEAEEPPELVTSRKETKFGTLLPDRFRPDPATPGPPAAPRRRGGCSGCGAGGGGLEGGGAGLVVGVGVLVGLLRRRSGAATGGSGRRT